MVVWCDRLGAYSPALLKLEHGMCCSPNAVTLVFNRIVYAPAIFRRSSLLLKFNFFFGFNYICGELLGDNPPWIWRELTAFRGLRGLAGERR